MVTVWAHNQLSSFGEPTLEVDKETFLLLVVFRTLSGTTAQKKEGFCILHIRASGLGMTITVQHSEVGLRLVGVYVLLKEPSS